ncbi:MAG TPA: YggS family pyridoxal phosphate-dependent enzyme [Thermoanaerobaculia bacterium]|nr:YggS family pyridoxal phosphate-dependent enzyme [Thermoanaerobaculia bacterium]
MTELSSDDIRQRVSAVMRRIARAAERSRRDPAGVSLLAVTKGHSAEMVQHAARAGVTLFGENRVAEGAEKIDLVRQRWPGLVWRLIGPLQTNKARRALQYFSAVESLDRQRLVDRLESLLAPEGRVLPVLIELNLGGEATKSGISADQAEQLLAAALAQPHLDVRGLMTVPPFTADPEGARPYFRQLAELRQRFSDRFGRPLSELSMGMSHDFEVGVEEGSTEVRIGTELFGPRLQGRLRPQDDVA